VKRNYYLGIVCLFIFGSLITGCTKTTSKNDTAMSIGFGMTLNQIKEGLEQRDEKYRLDDSDKHNTIITIEDYETIEGEKLDLSLFFLDSLIIGEETVALNEAKLGLYTYSKEEATESYIDKVYQYLALKYGEPIQTNFEEAVTDENEVPSRTAMWETGEGNVKLRDYTTSQGIRFVNVTFVVSESQKATFTSELPRPRNIRSEKVL